MFDMHVTSIPIDEVAALLCFSFRTMHATLEYYMRWGSVLVPLIRHGSPQARCDRPNGL